MTRLTDCAYCGRSNAKGVHNGRGGHLFISRATMIGPDRCGVCNDGSGRCAFARACSCWRGKPCRVAA